MKRWCAIPLAAAALAALALPASAADRPVYKAAPFEPVEHGDLYFGFDVTSHNSLAAYAGVIFAPYGTNTSGLRLTLFGLVGGYQYDSGLITIKGRFSSVDALVGYGFVSPNGTFTLSAGLNFQDHSLSPADPTNPVQGSLAGLKIQGDYWGNPSPSTLLFAIASYSTAFHTYYALGRFGWDITGRELFVGPEIGALGNDRTDQVRLGIFFNGFKLGKTGTLTVSTGYMSERDEGSGWYGTATADFRF